MAFRVIRVCLVVEDFVEDAVCVPGCAGADEFAVCCAQCEEDGVVEFFVVGDEVEFVGVDYVEFGSAYGFGVVWVGFYVLPFVSSTLVFWGFLYSVLGSFWRKLFMCLIMSLVCLQLGPKTPMLVSGLVNA